MFTGIIETLGTLTHLSRAGTNIDLNFKSSISEELKVDQSVAHNGVCLTVVELLEGGHRVTAIQETLERSSLGGLKVGDPVNLERAMLANARMDGHLVQGHVDTTTSCISKEERDGSWWFTFELLPDDEALVVEKGSVCIDGVSLTVAGVGPQHFSVAIIPYTFEHTTFHRYQPGTMVNIEFDIIGKYLARQLAVYQQADS